MLRLLSFLSRNRNAILFCLLEAIALYLVIHANDPQRHRVGDAMLEFTGSIGQGRRQVSGYFSLREENKRLMTAYDSVRRLHAARAEELNRLRATIEVDSAGKSRVDSILSKRRDSFTFLPAQVLRNSTHKDYNYLTLDQGAAEGIEVGMGVVAPEGVVGRVIKVSEHYALVQSAINLAFRLAVRVVNPQTGPPGHLGFFEWKGTDISTGEVNYVPETATLAPGDLVLTAGSSTIFPSGYQVGNLAGETPSPSEGFYQVKVQLAVDFSSLDHVFLIQSNHKAALDSLEVNLPEGNE